MTSQKNTDNYQFGVIRKNVLISVFFTVFIDLLGFGMFIPVLPNIARLFHASDSQAALLSTWFSLAMLISVGITGYMSDRFGRKRVIVSLVFVSFIAQIMTGFSQTYAFLVLSRIIAGMANGNIAAAQACIADLSKPGERSKFMVVIGLAFGGGFALGPALGTGVILLTEHFQFFSGNYFKCISIVAAGLNLINIALIIARQPETHYKFANQKIKNLIEYFNPNIVEDYSTHKKKVVFSKQIFSLLQTPSFCIVNLIIFLQAFAFVGIETLLPMLLKDAYKFADLQIYRSYIFIGIVTLIGNATLARMFLKRIGEVHTLHIGQILLTIGIASIAFFCPNENLLYMGLVFLCLGTSVANPSLNGLISKISPANSQGLAFGISQTAGSFARITGPAFMGFTYENGLGISFFQKQNSLYISSIILLLGFLFSFIALRAKQKEQALNLA